MGSLLEVLTSGRARDQIIATCARSIWLLSCLFNIHISMQHIPGKSNSVADSLSRWTGSQQDYQKLHKSFLDVGSC